MYFICMQKKFLTEIYLPNISLSKLFAASAPAVVPKDCLSRPPRRLSIWELTHPTMQLLSPVRVNLILQLFANFVWSLSVALIWLMYLRNYLTCSKVDLIFKFSFLEHWIKHFKIGVFNIKIVRANSALGKISIFNDIKRANKSILYKSKLKIFR